MGRIKLTVHPLFVIFGLYFALRGKVFSFLIFTLSALIHELGHAIAADRIGYQLKRVVLMPYGAVIKGDSRDMDYRDEIKIALAGPLLSLLIAGLFVSVWWLAPNAYPYTEIVVVANLSLAALNFLPAYPLDGGRIVLAATSLWLGRKRAKRICAAVGIAVGVAVLGLFVYSAFTEINYSILFFGLFMIFGNIFISKEAEYVRIANFISFAPIIRPTAIRHLAIDEGVTVKEIIKQRRSGEMIALTVYSSSGIRIGYLPPEKVANVMQTRGLNECFGSIVKEQKSEIIDL